MHIDDFNSTQEYYAQQEFNAIMLIGFIIAFMFIATYFIGETK